MHNETNDIKYAFELTEILLHPFLVFFLYRSSKYAKLNVFRPIGNLNHWAVL